MNISKISSFINFTPSFGNVRPSAILRARNNNVIDKEGIEQINDIISKQSDNSAADIDSNPNGSGFVVIQKGKTVSEAVVFDSLASAAKYADTIRNS